MSIDSLNRVIRRAVAEPAFQALLLRDAGQALCDYDLSASELAMLSGLTTETFDALAGELDRRVSRGVVAGSFTGGSTRPGGH